MVRKAILAGVAAVLGLAIGAAQAETIRIAEHRQARIDALKRSVPAIEKKYGVTIEVVEYPAPEKDYLTKLLTELGAGNAPDIFTANSDADVSPTWSPPAISPRSPPTSRHGTAIRQLFDVAKKLVDRQGRADVLARLDAGCAAALLSPRHSREGRHLDRAAEDLGRASRPGAGRSRPRPARTACCFPAGVTWGGGAFGEGFNMLIVGTQTPQIANDDGTLNLTGEGIKDAFGFYATSSTKTSCRSNRCSGPEPWVIPKYEMFPAGKLVATTCGSWCYIYDWGPESKNPVPERHRRGRHLGDAGQGRRSIRASSTSQNPWAGQRQGGRCRHGQEGAARARLGRRRRSPMPRRSATFPARKDAAEDPDFQALKALVPVHRRRRQRARSSSRPTGFSVGRRGRRAGNRGAAPQADRRGRRAADPRRLRHGPSRRRRRQIEPSSQGRMTVEARLGAFRLSFPIASSITCRRASPPGDRPRP